LAEKTTGEAYQNSQDTFKETIQKFSLSEATAQERELLSYLLWDMEHQVCLGEQNATPVFAKEDEETKGFPRNLIWWILGIVVGVACLSAMFVFWKK